MAEEAASSKDAELLRALRAYLGATVAQFLEGHQAPFLKSLEGPTDGVLKSFLEDAHLSFLLVNKKYTQELTGSESPEELEALEEYVYSLEVPSNAGSKGASIAFIKVHFSRVFETLALKFNYCPACAPCFRSNPSLPSMCRWPANFKFASSTRTRWAPFCPASGPAFCPTVAPLWQ